MIRVGNVLEHLPLRHREALLWFRSNAGQRAGWPQPLADGTLVASRAKGIYKPQWSKYALSVRQNLGSPYLDQTPVDRPDGTWSYRYFQENIDIGSRDVEYTNRAMLECFNDAVPVGVIREVEPHATTTYEVLGLAMVTGWEEGYFLLEGFSRSGGAHGPNAGLEILMARRSIEDLTTAALWGAMDERVRTSMSIVRRVGQAEFRRRLLRAYQGRCAITGCDVPQALEASHILPYRGRQTSETSNGLLLRADVHTLYDLGLLDLHEDTLSVLVSPKLRDTVYGDLAGKRLTVPASLSDRPSADALRIRRHWTRVDSFRMAP